MTCKTKKCKYQGDVPYSCHSRCMHPLIGSKKDDPMTDLLTILGGRMTYKYSVVLAKVMGVKGSSHGITNGWFNWPFNFDPVWLESCNMFEELKENECDDEKESSDG